MKGLDITKLKWDHGLPTFHLVLGVTDDHLDIMGHTNNVQYVNWMEQISWAHSEQLGLDWDRYETLNRAMVARRHEVDYLAATFSGDRLVLGTWIAENNQKTTVVRIYQLIRVLDGVTVLRGRTKWVCIDLESGKPKRMPPEFVQAYKVCV